MDYSLLLIIEINPEYASYANNMKSIRRQTQ